jgi:hypothetical protein
MKTATFQIPDKEYNLFLIVAEKFGAIIQHDAIKNQEKEDIEMYEWARNYKSDTSFENENDVAERLGRRVPVQRKPASASELEEAKKFIMNYKNGFKGIPNPSEWQREIRQDRPLPGRE